MRSRSEFFEQVGGFDNNLYLCTFVNLTDLFKTYILTFFRHCFRFRPLCYQISLHFN